VALVWTATEGTGFVDAGWVSPYTFSAVGIGTASADRYVIVCIFSRDRNVASVTIGGSAATLIAQERGGTSRDISMWGRLVTSGTTADVVITATSSTFNDIGIVVGHLTGANTTPTSTTTNSYGYDPDPHAVTLTVPSGGIMLVALGAEDNAAALTWSQGTEDYELHGTGTTLNSGYLDGVSGSQEVSITGCDYNGCGVVAAAFEPAAAGNNLAWKLASSRPSLAGVGGLAG